MLTAVFLHTVTLLLSPPELMVHLLPKDSLRSRPVLGTHKVSGQQLTFNTWILYTSLSEHIKFKAKHYNDS